MLFHRKIIIFYEGTRAQFYCFSIISNQLYHTRYMAERDSTRFGQVKFAQFWNQLYDGPSLQTGVVALCNALQ